MRILPARLQCACSGVFRLSHGPGPIGASFLWGMTTGHDRIRGEYSTKKCRPPKSAMETQYLILNTGFREICPTEHKTSPAQTTMPVETPSYASITDTAASDAMVNKNTPFPAPPKFSSELEEREYIKFRVAEAFRISVCPLTFIFVRDSKNMT